MVHPNPQAKYFATVKAVEGQVIGDPLGRLYNEAFLLNDGLLDGYNLASIVQYKQVITIPMQGFALLQLLIRAEEVFIAGNFEHIFRDHVLGDPMDECVLHQFLYEVSVYFVDC